MKDKLSSNLSQESFCPHSQRGEKEHWVLLSIHFEAITGSVNHLLIMFIVLW